MDDEKHVRLTVRRVSRPGTAASRLFSRPGSSKGKTKQSLKKVIRKSASLPCSPLEDPYFQPQIKQVSPDEFTEAGARMSESSISQISPANRSGTDLKEKFFSVQPNIGLEPTPTVLSKSRTQKFHKLFKTVPDHEYPIDYFSCAFIGDILLQGNLYVSQNWFCFYSRIRGRGRLLEIPMETVISITREKTAIIFPNAIGLQTKTDKFAFGSFMTRDSTYKFLVSMWKKSQEAKSSGGNTDVTATLRATDQGPEKLVVSGSQLSNERLISDLSNQLHSTHSKSDSSDQSESSICFEANSVDDMMDLNSYGKNTGSFVGKTDSNSNSSPVHQPPVRNVMKQKSHVSKEKRMSHVRKKGLEGKRLQFPYSVIHCIDRGKTVSAFQKSVAKLQRIPRTNLMLAICTLLVLFLLLSAVGLTYKILDLEAKILSRGTWSEADGQKLRHRWYSDLLGVQSIVRDSTAQHVQNVLSANIKVLQEINSSLHELQASQSATVVDVCTTDQC